MGATPRLGLAGPSVEPPGALTAVLGGIGVPPFSIPAYVAMGGRFSIPCDARGPSPQVAPAPDPAVAGPKGLPAPRPGPACVGVGRRPLREPTRRGGAARPRPRKKGPSMRRGPAWLVGRAGAKRGHQRANGVVNKPTKAPLKGEPPRRPSLPVPPYRKPTVGPPGAGHALPDQPNRVRRTLATRGRGRLRAVTALLSPSKRPRPIILRALPVLPPPPGLVPLCAPLRRASEPSSCAPAVSPSRRKGPRPRDALLWGRPGPG